MNGVDAAGWRAAVQRAREDGFGYFDWLGCVDEIGRADSLRVVLALRHAERPEEVRLLGVEVPRDDPRVDSIRDLFAGAAWHEREAAELFGVRFVGGDRRRLLLAPEYEGTPMRKDEVLAARTGLSWPGAKEPGESAASAGAASPGRRRTVPPGVPDPEIWGDRREPAAADPAAVVESLSGARVRRRPR